MAATINNFISAMLSTSQSLDLLSGAVAERNVDGSLAVVRTSHFAELRIEWRGKSYLLSLPLNSEAAALAQRTSVSLRQLRSALLPEYRLLPSELSYLTSSGRVDSTDLVLEELHSGSFLSECVGHRDPLELFGAVDALQAEFERLQLTHSNLKTENIIVGDDLKLYAQRMHYAVVGEGANDDFDSLRNLIFEVHDVEPAECELHESVAAPQNVMYGYQSVGNPFEGMCVAENHLGYGYIDEQGSEIISPRFIWAGDMREGRAEVETAEGMGLIDASGNYIIVPKYQIVEFDSSTGLSRVKDGDEWKTFDYQGREI